jgi:hypothetical protein
VGACSALVAPLVAALRRYVLGASGEGFDPEMFDRRAANAALLRMAWNRWGGK